MFPGQRQVVVPPYQYNTPNAPVVVSPAVYGQAYSTQGMGKYAYPPRRPPRRAPAGRTFCVVVILAILTLLIIGGAILLGVLLNQGTEETTIAIEIDAAKMNVPFFGPTDQPEFFEYELQFCNDIRTVVRNNPELEDVMVITCELLSTRRYVPRVAGPDFNITGTNFRVRLVLETSEESTKVIPAAITQLIRAAQDGQYQGIPLPCFVNIDTISFPGIKNTPIIFEKVFCFELELNAPRIQYVSGLLERFPEESEDYEMDYCSDVRRTFRLEETSGILQVEDCKLDRTEEFEEDEDGVQPPGTTFVLVVKMRRLDALTEFMALYKVNRDLNQAIATHSIEGRAAFIAIASGQYLLPRGSPPATTTTTTSAPSTTTTTTTEIPVNCSSITITVPATVTVGSYLVNLTYREDNPDTSDAAVTSKIEGLPIIANILERCAEELNCIHRPEIQIDNVGTSPQYLTEFTLSLTAVISVTGSPSERAVIYTASGYTKTTSNEEITVLDCDIESCQTYNGGCADVCFTDYGTETYSCRCPDDQILVDGDCTEWTAAVDCSFCNNPCVFEIASGDETYSSLCEIGPALSRDNELTLRLNVTLDNPACMTFGYVFESTCTDNFLILTSGNGVVLWSATYTPFTGATINIPAGLTDLKFVMKSVGPMVFVTDVFVTQGPCGRVRLTGGDTDKEGILEFNFNNVWYPFCQQDNFRETIPNLCHHLGFNKTMEVYDDASEFTGGSEASEYISSLSCFFDVTVCSSLFLQACGTPNVVDTCPNGLQGVKCIPMERGPEKQGRLLIGSASSNGRLEVFTEGDWYSVSANNQLAFPRSAEAATVCKSLGYSGGSNVNPLTLPGYNLPFRSIQEYWEVPPLVRYEIQCPCGAPDLSYCRLTEVTNPANHDLVAIFCEEPIPVPIMEKISSNRVRLVGRTVSLPAGRVEVSLDGQYGTARYDVSLFDKTTAGIVCRTLNLGWEGVAVNSIWGFGSGPLASPVWLEDLQCRGDEFTLAECTCATFDRSRLLNDHTKDVAVACGYAREPVLNQVEVRLVDIKTESLGVRGRVEVRRRDLYTGVRTQWGTVCDDFVDYQEVGVLCNMMGYSGGGEPLANFLCGPGEGDILVDNLRCDATTEYLTQCSALPWGQNNCGHHEDLCVYCTTDPIDVQLVGPFNPLVVISYGGRQGVVVRSGPGGDGPDEDTSKLLCSLALNVDKSEIEMTDPFFLDAFSFNVPDNAVKLIQDLKCGPNATRLEDCSHPGFGRANSEATVFLGLNCQTSQNDAPPPASIPGNPPSGTPVNNTQPGPSTPGDTIVIQDRAAINCTFDDAIDDPSGPCRTSILGVNINGGVGTVLGVASLSQMYDEDFDSCVCVNVSKAGRGAIVLIIAYSTTTFAENVVEDLVYHTEPTDGWENVCTTVRSTSNLADPSGIREVDVVVRATQDSEVEIEDWTFTPGQCDPVVPAANQWECPYSSQVIYGPGRCDGFVDCLADEDESDCSLVPGYCDFNTNCDGWINTGTILWQRNKGHTPTLNTGPHYDLDTILNPLAFTTIPERTLFEGKLFPDSPQYYLYMNANDGQPGEKAQYTYNVASGFEGCLRFHYSMIGLDVASLQVERVEANGDRTILWRLEFQQNSAVDPSDMYRFAQIYVLMEDGDSLVITAVRGNSRYSDIALDSLYLSKTGPCPETPSCPADFHKCGDGSCIPPLRVGDGIKHCSDNSDEDGFPPPPPSECLRSEFRCLSGECIPGSWVCDDFDDCSPLIEDEASCQQYPSSCEGYECDGQSQCRDGSDEAYCPSGCGYGLLMDITGRCYPESLQCNGVFDTYGFGDELNCDCKEIDSTFAPCGAYCVNRYFHEDGVPNCPMNTDEDGSSGGTLHVFCNDTQSEGIIPGYWLCDGFLDCPGATDEPADCECDPAYHLDCNGRCMYPGLACDGTMDCSGGIDEQNCGECAAGICNCQEGRAECGDKAGCVEKGRVCDGVFDCADRSDEDSCELRSCDPAYQFTCSNGYCISKRLVNDGSRDCSDGSDERAAQCAAYQKQCGDGTCFTEAWFDDGVNDCEDLSDEAWNPCQDGEFRCLSGECIPRSERCNGNENCNDGSDEQYCESQTSTCHAYQFKCLTSVPGQPNCAPENTMCDRVFECPDNSDEGFCKKDYQLAVGSCWSLEPVKFCDGVFDCVDESDEETCIEVGADGTVMIGGLPVCFTSNWENAMSTGWAQVACTESGRGWIGATVVRGNVGSYGEYVVIDGPVTLPNNNNLLGNIRTVASCTPDPYLVKAYCPSIIGGYRITQQPIGDWTATNQIVGGRTARSPSESPFTVAVTRRGKAGCSGVILNQCWVATAAHCVTDRSVPFMLQDARFVRVVIGIDRTAGNSLRVSQIHVHPDFVREPSIQDIALLQLETCLSFSTDVKPIGLPYPGQEFEGKYCEVAGFGAISEDTRAAEVLRIAKANVVPGSICDAALLNWDDNFHICVHDDDNFRSQCGGDSGGPLYCSSKLDPQFFVLAGLVSFGPESCNGVNGLVRVTAAVPWMITIMEEYQCVGVKNCQPWSIYT